jgi:hypothetical protein
MAALVSGLIGKRGHPGLKFFHAISSQLTMMLRIAAGVGTSSTASAKTSAGSGDSGGSGPGYGGGGAQPTPVEPPTSSGAIDAAQPARPPYPVGGIRRPTGSSQGLSCSHVENVVDG